MTSHFSRLLSVVALAVLCLSPVAAHAAPQGLALTPGSIVQINKALCGFVNNAWVPGRVLKTGNFVTLSEDAAILKQQIKKKGISATAKARLQARQKALKRKIKTNAGLCGTLSPSGPGPTATPTPVATPASPLPGHVTVAWAQTAYDLRNNVGGDYYYFCPANPTQSLNAIYGHDTYTADSPICVAAAHMGLFARGVGGNIRIRIKGPQGFYYGSVRNGIQSNFYGAYDYSYSFVTVNSGAEIVSNLIPQITWSQTAAPMYTFLSQQFSLYCPSGIGQTRSIWGTDVYTYDSSICTAAVHAGRISLAAGGVVTIQIEPGQASYAASVRNGITSSSYGSWGGSFRFVP